ncbi:MAG TPA: hypothetical protein VK557_03025 [Pyrinomonadaceae bacterium]|nr:hypothetical protein [Pyrinomonadaceae bacterium]
MKKKTTGDFDNDVFINCPFDKQYIRLFRAVVFTTHLLGFRVRCSQELDHGKERLEKITNLIKSCKYGIHDISRIQRTGRMPRFNMPFELGIDIAFQVSGDEKLSQKSILILDSDPYRYKQFLSDLAGRDARSHSNRVADVITAVRNWLNDGIKGTPRHPLPSGTLVHKEYVVFRRNLKKICAELDLGNIDELTFNDYAYVVALWLERRGPSRRRPVPKK